MAMDPQPLAGLNKAMLRGISRRIFQQPASSRQPNRLGNAHTMCMIRRQLFFEEFSEETA